MVWYFFLLWLALHFMDTAHYILADREVKSSSWKYMLPGGGFLASWRSKRNGN